MWMMQCVSWWNRGINAKRIKEHDRDKRFACAQTSAVSEHANKTGHILLFGARLGLQIVILIGTHVGQPINVDLWGNTIKQPE